jgi:hypothetical protein
MSSTRRLDRGAAKLWLTNLRSEERRNKIITEFHRKDRVALMAVHNNGSRPGNNHVLRFAIHQ